MTDDDARQIATRAIDTWPAGPKGYIWQNELKPLDRDHAAEAMRRLRQEGADIRNITAQFHAAYRAIRGAVHVTLAPARCELCNGTGRVSATPVEAHDSRYCKGTPGSEQGLGGCWCHAVRPCRCSNAHQAHVVTDLIHREHT